MASSQPVDISGLKQNFYVHISSPDETMFEGEAQAITTLSEKGVFDVLPLHENFIALIKTKVIVHYQVGAENKEFALESGVIKVHKNKVYVLTGFELFAELTDQAEIEAAAKFKIHGISIFNPFSTKI